MENPSRLNWLLRSAFLVAIISMAGSLFFSEVLKLPPCVLCWYQRICMYPLVLIFTVGLLKTGRECLPYALGLTVIGFLISFYHNLLYYKILPDSITPCSEGVSCTSIQIQWLGFITIPLMSLVAFTILLTLLLILLRRTSLDQKNEKVSL